MRKHLMLLLIVVLATLVAPAWAGDTSTMAEEESDLLSANLDKFSIIVAIVTFLVLVFLLTKLAWKPILNGLQAREETIRNAVDDAQKASEEARAYAEEYKAKLDTANEEARRINEEARKNAEVVRRQIEEEAQKQAETTLARSVKEIGQAKQAAMNEILSDVADIATETASKIIQRSLTPEDNAGVIDEVVKDFIKARSSGADA